MSTGSVVPPSEVFRTPYYRQASPQRPLKRKFDVLASSATARVPLSYPSPPMSRPPSPLPPTSEISVYTSGEIQPATQQALASGTTSFRSTASQIQPWTTSERTSLAAPPLGPFASRYTELGTLQTSQSFATPPVPSFTGPNATGASASRTGRKSKAHVASACVNCKRAHLSCDVQRPCGRCVASGKQVVISLLQDPLVICNLSTNRTLASMCSTRSEVAHVCERIAKRMAIKQSRSKGSALLPPSRPKHPHHDLSPG